MKPKIYTYYDPTADAPKHQAELLRLWFRSWEARGWRPRLLTVRHAQRSRRFRANKPNQHAFLALEVATRGQGGWFCAPNVINFSFAPSTPPAKRKSITAFVFPYGATSWKLADLVEFPFTFSMQDILNCGRPVVC